MASSGTDPIKLSMEESRMKMKLEEMPKRDLGIAISIFTAFFIISLIVGFHGPDVYNTSSLYSYQCRDGSLVFNETTCTGDYLGRKYGTFAAIIDNLDKLDRELDITVEFEHTNYKTLSIEAEVEIEMAIGGRDKIGDEWNIINGKDKFEYHRKVKCEKGSLKCKSTRLFHITFLNYKSYSMALFMKDDNPWMQNAKFNFRYVNEGFTVFELWFRIVFLILSVGVFVWYIAAMNRVSIYDWTLEQKWMIVLSVGVIFLNNPFYVFTMSSDHLMPYVMDNIFMFGFIAILLSFWLCLLDGLRKSSNLRTIYRFYLPKFILIGLLWIFAVAAFSLISKFRNDDPGYDPTDDVESVKVLLGFYFFLIAYYIAWLLYVIYKAIREVSKIQHLRLRVRIFLSLKFAVIFITIIGLLAGAVDTFNNNAASFLVYFSLFNTYVYLMSYLYSPARYLYDNTAAPNGFVMTRLDDDATEAEFVQVEIDRDSPHRNAYVVDDGASPRSTPTNSTSPGQNEEDAKPSQPNSSKSPMELATVQLDIE